MLSPDRPLCGILASLLCILEDADINERWGVGVNVANALDNSHFESFGGDLLARRALAYLVFTW